MTDILTHLDIDAWLQDPKGTRLALSPPVVNGNQITTTIKVENPKVFRPAGKHGHLKIARIASYFMAANDARTQTRSSHGRLELPLQKNAWLWTSSRTGFVSLEISRLSHTPRERRPADETDPESMSHEGTLEDDEGATTLPSIIFRFEFEPKEDPTRIVTQYISSSSSNKRGARRSSLRTRKTYQDQASELSELSSSESEPEGPALAFAHKPERTQVGGHGEGSKLLTDLEKTAKTSPPEEDTISALLKKRVIDGSLHVISELTFKYDRKLSWNTKKQSKRRRSRSAPNSESSSKISKKIPRYGQRNWRMIKMSRSTLRSA
ncbi:hypothetical protein B0H17DRAFT_1141652 [Mycena rosella]|uniref:Uncharacterized protein n=1 Tax=Mycena rosella TaxID=1033263 RepID=A0AAD7G6D3_MYCRO|nr:hypothetical protein B0H17DRAFT_1141652 [Mycena rosella]